MFRCDYHTHCNYSNDSESKMEHMIASAVDKGLSEVAVTDHVDLCYPPVDYIITENFDFDGYRNELMSLREKYRDKIYVAFGVEMGIQTRCLDEIKEFMSGKQFDVVIASTHVVDFKDLYDGSYSEGKTQKQCYQGYFEEVYNIINAYDDFDVYGHLDFICRYGNYPDKILKYNDYKEIIDEILCLLIKKDKAIEVNSSGFRYGVGHPHPQFEIIKAYKDLGGEIITTSSDAHLPCDVAWQFDDIYDMLEAAGFKTVATYRNRKPHLVKI